jgi:hypothetical protein
MINRFRREVYQSFERRGDAGMDLVDALTSSMTIESPVALSESPLYRRRFSSVYDFLRSGRIWLPELRRVLAHNQPDDVETIAGYAVYALDCTNDPAPEAETLFDRSLSKKGRQAPIEIGHRYSWLVRLVQWRTSWCMPQDIRRVSSDSSDSQVGSEQVQALAHRTERPKVVVADSWYCNAIFLAFFLTVDALYALVRMRSNRVLYEEPPARQPGQRGRPRKHGRKFMPSAPWRAPDRIEESTLLGQQVCLKAWENLHFYKLPLLVGTVLSVQFLKADGTPRFKRPLYLFWTGPTSVALVDLARMYLWRFAIEHMFRFLKQHLGLTASNSPDLENRLRWTWCCAIAYCQLLHIRHHVAERRPEWHPRHVQGRLRPMTPRQVQRQALPVLLALGTPASSTRPAGKGRGRSYGYCPDPRPRFSVVRKGKKRRNAA